MTTAADSLQKGRQLFLMHHNRSQGGTTNERSTILRISCRGTCLRVENVLKRELLKPARFTLSWAASFGVTPREWRNWQTRQAQDLVGVKSRGGSSPLSRTMQDKGLRRQVVGPFSLVNSHSRKYDGTEIRQMLVFPLGRAKISVTKLASLPIGW